MTKKNILLDRTASLMEVLSDQERAICDLLINGNSNVQISTELNMSEDSVKNSTISIFNKVGLTLEKILTERERQICELAIDGSSNYKIAELLKKVVKSQKTSKNPSENITEGAVRIHMSNIYRKIGIHSRADLIVCYKKLKEAAVALTFIVPSPLPLPPAIAKLRLEGEGVLPNVIPIVFRENNLFTIGRHDVSIAKKQRDFEFENSDMTCSISRMHAVIEQLPCGGFVIIDKSSFGTIVNGERLLRDEPRQIFHGDRISLADTQVNYVFEECSS